MFLQDFFFLLTLQTDMLLKQNTQPTELQSQLRTVRHMTSFINGQISFPPPPFFFVFAEVMCQSIVVVKVLHNTSRAAD